MFRYNKDGLFNVPYGGIAYNNKNIDDKISRITNRDIKQRFADTQICNLEFDDFLDATRPNENDFIFLDPPYDTEFSSYNNREFLENDQKRLADYLCNNCVAKWMIVIKKTEMIERFYSRPGLKISYFDKRYAVSFKARNEPNVSHMIITNY
jgi:DNA adenine methylase